jgi:hypothetical protein
VTGDVLPQDSYQLRQDGHDTDSAAWPVLQAALLMTGSAVGPVLADARSGLVQFEATPVGLRQVAVLNAERGRFCWPEHREVQAGEEGNQTVTTTWANVADCGEELVHLLRRGDARSGLQELR